MTYGEKSREKKKKKGRKEEFAVRYLSKVETSAVGDSSRGGVTEREERRVLRTEPGEDVQNSERYGKGNREGWSDSESKD